MKATRIPEMKQTAVEAKLRNLKASGKADVSFSVGGVAGLKIRWRGSNNIQWCFRSQSQGLKAVKTAPYASMSLQQAREWARFILEHNGKTPKEIEAETPHVKTVAQLWPEFLEDSFKSGQWTYSPKVQANKEAFGRNHVFPYMGDLSPEEVDYPQVIEALNGAISNDNRKKRLIIIRQFLKWCKPKGLRTKPLPTDIDELKTYLTAIDIKLDHQPAVGWKNVPRFVHALMSGKNSRSIGALALLFKILTVSRNEPVRLAQWSEFDADFSLWTVPRQHMKEKHDKKNTSNKVRRTDPHLVPLSNQARKILLLLKSVKGTTGLVFGSGFGANFGRPITDATLKAYIVRVNAREERAGREGFRDKSQLDKKGNPRVAVPHGFRSDFESWALENGYPERIINMCQDHLDKTDAYNGAYRRDDQLERRRELLQAWADYCLGQCPADWL